MRITVDADLCEGYGICRKLLPERFRVTDELPVTILQPDVTAGERERVQALIRKCPRAALKLVED